MQNFSYHTHTTFSDGKNTVEEMLIKAKELGWEEIGISDHLQIHKNMDRFISENTKYEKLKNISMFSSFSQAVDVVNKRSEFIRKTANKLGIKAYIGHEVDCFSYPEWQEKFVDFSKKVDVDYYISGNHFFFDENAENLLGVANLRRSNISPKEYKNHFEIYYKALQKSIESCLFAFLAHLDFIRLDLSEDAIDFQLPIINALQKSNTGIELSTKGLRRDGDFFPTKRLLDEVVKAGLSVVISDDAHNIEELGKDFDKAEALLATYPNIKRFSL